MPLGICTGAGTTDSREEYAGEFETVQSEQLGVATRGPRCGDIYFARQGGEIQCILARDVNRSLVRISFGDQREARGGPRAAANSES